MATLTKSGYKMRVDGGKRSVICRVTPGSGVTSGEVDTGLAWVDHAVVRGQDADDAAVNCYHNSASAAVYNSSTNGDYKGWIHVAGMTAESTYQIIATGV